MDRNLHFLKPSGLTLSFRPHGWPLEIIAQNCSTNPSKVGLASDKGIPEMFDAAGQLVSSCEEMAGVKFQSPSSPMF